MTKDEVFKIPTDELHVEQRKLYSFSWGPSSRYDLNGVDRSEVLEEVEFSFDPLQPYKAKEPYFREAHFGGFVLGSLLHECSPKMEREGFRQIRHVKRFRSFLCVTKNKFQHKLSFFLQEDGSEILYGNSIGQENLKEIRDERRRVWDAKKNAREKARRDANRWKQILNEDEMLRNWAKHCKPWDDYSESQFIDYANWLIGTNSYERHIAANSWNWDYGIAPPIWITRKPDTDIATAISIFFLFEPSYYLQYAGNLDAVDSPHERFMLRNLLELKKRIETGFYTTSNIRADFWREIGNDERYKAQFPEIGHTYPKNIRQIYNGTDPNEAGINIPDFGIY